MLIFLVGCGEMGGGGVLALALAFGWWWITLTGIYRYWYMDECTLSYRSYMLLFDWSGLNDGVNSCC